MNSSAAELSNVNAQAPPAGMRRMPSSTTPEGARERLQGDSRATADSRQMASLARGLWDLWRQLKKEAVPLARTPRLASASRDLIFRGSQANSRRLPPGFPKHHVDLWSRTGQLRRDNSITTLGQEATRA